MALTVEAIIKGRDELTGTLRAAQGSLGGFRGAVQAHAAGLRTAGLAMGAAGAGVIAFAASSIRAQGEQAQATAKLGAVLRAQGRYSEETMDAFTGQASALQKVTTFEDETTVGAQAMLAGFKLAPDLIMRTTKAAQDLATVKGTDLGAAAFALGRALANPERGMLALTRLGIQINKESLAGLTIEQQRAKILAEIEGRFRGAAAAVGATDFGTWQRFLNQIGEIKESVGAALGPALQAILPPLTAVAEAFARFASAHPHVVAMGIALGALLVPLGMIVGWLPSVVSGLAAIGAGAKALLAGKGLAAVFSAMAGGVGAAAAGGGAAAGAAAAGGGAAAVVAGGGGAATFAGLAAAIGPVIAVLGALAVAGWSVHRTWTVLAEAREARSQARAGQAEWDRRRGLLGGAVAASGAVDREALRRRAGGRKWRDIIASDPEFAVRVQIEPRTASRQRHALAMVGA